MPRTDTIRLQPREALVLDGQRLAACVFVLTFAAGVWGLAAVGLAELLGLKG